VISLCENWRNISAMRLYRNPTRPATGWIAIQLPARKCSNFFSQRQMRTLQRNHSNSSTICGAKKLLLVRTPATGRAGGGLFEMSDSTSSPVIRTLEKTDQKSKTNYGKQGKKAFDGIQSRSHVTLKMLPMMTRSNVKALAVPPPVSKPVKTNK
jgi:hypothetical protein